MYHGPELFSPPCLRRTRKREEAAKVCLEEWAPDTDLVSLLQPLLLVLLDVDGIEQYELDLLEKMVSLKKQLMVMERKEKSSSEKTKTRRGKQVVKKGNDARVNEAKRMTTIQYQVVQGLWRM